MQELLVLETQGAVASTMEVLRGHSIPSMVSRDLFDSLHEQVEAWIQVPDGDEDGSSRMALMGKGLHEYKLVGTTISVEP